MIKIPIGLQDLRRKIYVKAKAEPSWRFWGLYVHVCKLETLREAYRMARKNNGAPGIDGETFEAVEASGVAEFLEQIRKELISGAYRPLGVRHQKIPNTMKELEAYRSGSWEIDVVELPLDEVAGLFASGAIRHALVMCAFFHLTARGGWVPGERRP